jgi:hypothetical protein
MVCSKLSPNADMDVFRQSFYIKAGFSLVVRRIEFGEANIQIEIIFGSGRSDGRQRLVKKPQSSGILSGLRHSLACLTRSRAFTKITCTPGNLVRLGRFIDL